MSVLRASGIVVGLLLGVVGVASAQAPLTLANPDERRPVTGVVFDIRGIMAALPTAEGWVPSVPESPPLPGRGFGGEVGGHVYLASLGRSRVGLGASAGLGRRSASADGPKDGATPTALQAAGISVTSQVRYLAPQVSLNFGHSRGWSYLSGGYGLAQVRSEATGKDGRLPLAVDTGWGRAINMGFGARWMRRSRLGFSVDLRWHRVAGGSGGTGSSATRAGATLLNMAVGVAFR